MTMNGNQQTREEFGATSLATTGETHTSALVAAAQAGTNARYIMALQRPRSWDNVRTRLLLECERPAFAKVARYRKPIGKGVTGPSIRFAEACFRLAGNLDAPVTTTFEDRERRILHLVVIDLETNASHSADITIDKTVERRDATDRVILGQRTNKGGETVFVVEATEDELLNKQNALVSKALRTLVLRLVPGDIVDEGQERCIKTTNDRNAKDPAAAKKEALDAFASVGVFPGALAEYVGHSLDALQPAELDELVQIYTSLRDGEATWQAVLEAKRAGTKEGAPPAATSAATPPAPKEKQTLEEKLKAQPAPAAPPPAPAAQPERKRDFVAEAEGIKEALSVAAAGKDKEAIKTIRARYGELAKAWPVELVKELQTFYVMVTGTKAEPAPESKPKPRDAYLPPHKRGEDYDGPDDPIG